MDISLLRESNHLVEHLNSWIHTFMRPFNYNIIAVFRSLSACLPGLLPHALLLQPMTQRAVPIKFAPFDMIRMYSLPNLFVAHRCFFAVFTSFRIFGSLGSGRWGCVPLCSSFPVRKSISLKKKKDPSLFSSGNLEDEIQVGM